MMSLPETRWPRVLCLLPLALALGCGVGDPPATQVDGLHRLLVGVDAGEPWKEVKARADDAYRNVLFSPENSGPASEWRSEPLAIPAGTALDVGMALATGAAPNARARFVVEAEYADGRRELLARTVEGNDGWVDARVGLDALAHREVRFVFRSGAAAGAPEPAPATLWSNPLLIAPASARPTAPPNLVLISLDTLRADRLGAWGSERATTPNLDRFMNEGLIFERCFAPSSWTTPSHATVFTGHHPAVHGAGGPLGHRLQDRFTTLAELTRRRGYLTAAFTEGAAVAGQLGFHQGFDSYANGRGTRPFPAGTVETTFARAGAWLDRYGDLPFMLFVHTYEIHWPYRSTEPWAGMFDDGSAVLDTTQVNDVDFLQGSLSEAQKRALEAAYDAGVAQTDAVVGRFLEKLRTDGLLENTIIVIFSDHGEEFWEHRSTQHGFSLYDEVLHVPLFMKLAGEDPPRGRIEREVALGDIFATLVELFGFESEIPRASHSLVPLWEHDEPGREYRRTLVTGELVQTSVQWLMLSARQAGHKYIATTNYAHPESPLHPHRATLGRPPVTMEQRLIAHLLEGGRDIETAASDAERRRMFRSAREELYDLDADPGESRDLAIDDRERLRAARSELAAALRGLEADAADIGAPLEEVAPLGEEERSELRALGYLQ